MITTEIKTRPILFNAAMVLALLSGRKTETRRLLNPQPVNGVRACDSVSPASPSGLEDGHGRAIKMKFGLPGDKLWVRETLLWGPWQHDTFERLRYDADGAPVMDIPDDAKLITRGRLPCILMPRWASRIELEIDEVRVERVQMISEDEAKAEGIVKYQTGDPSKYVYGLPHWEPKELMPTARAAFLKLFYDINERAPGDTNPWVYVIKFARVK